MRRGTLSITQYLTSRNTWGIKVGQDQKAAEITSEQLRAARALIRWEQRHLADASGVSLPSIKRLETHPGPLAAQPLTLAALISALEKAGVMFVPENGEGPGVRLMKKHRRKKS